MAVVCAVGLLVAAVRFATALKSRVVVDDSGIDVNGKFKIAWDNITGADDSKYEKGFAKLTYKEQGGEEEKEYLIDRYMVDHFDELLDEISARRPDVLPPVEEQGQEPEQTDSTEQEKPKSEENQSNG